MLDPRECGLKSVAEAANPGGVGVWSLRVGLTNEELQKCHIMSRLVANLEYSPAEPGDSGSGLLPMKCMARLATQETGERVEHEETPYPLVDDLSVLFVWSSGTKRCWQPERDP